MVKSIRTVCGTAVLALALAACGEGVVGTSPEQADGPEVVVADPTPDVVEVVEVVTVLEDAGGVLALNDSGTLANKTFAGLGLQSGASYTLTFSAFVAAEEEGRFLTVDLFPDTLPQTRMLLSTEPTEFTWDVSSDDEEMTSAALRFFSHSPEASISVTDIKLVQN